MRPMALPRRLTRLAWAHSQVFLEYFVIEEGDSYDKTLAIVAEMGESIAESFEQYQECFENPAVFKGDVEGVLIKWRTSRCIDRATL